MLLVGRIPSAYPICGSLRSWFWKRSTAMRQELKERLAPLGPIRDIDRVSSGSPADVVLRPADGLPKVNTIAATLALARRHMTLAEAKTAIERMVENGEAVVHVPTVESEAAAGTQVDQVIGIVNGDLILESDVDEERRFSAFQPYRDPKGKFSREQAVERLVDRTLILQQSKLQPENAVTLDEARTQLTLLRKDIPACRTYHCETDAGWQKFVQDQGFTVAGLDERWRQRMEILKFIEQRFRMGIRISPEQIKAYYDKTLLPEYTLQKATPPQLSTISERIQEVLLQQQVGNLLADWLTALKAQGSVRMMKQGEVQP